MQGFAIVWLVGLMVSRAYFIREGRDLPLLFGTGIYRGSVVTTQSRVYCVLCVLFGAWFDSFRMYCCAFGVFTPSVPATQVQV